MFQWLKRAVEEEAPDVDAAREGEPADAIAAFWQFWAAHETTFLDGINHGTLSDSTDALHEAVMAIHPELGWEFGEGTTLDPMWRSMPW